MRRLRGCVSLPVFCFVIARLAQGAEPPAPADVVAKVEAYMDAQVARDKFSGSILVGRDGTVLFRRGYGLANREHGVPNTPETKFRLASLTKQFTAMAVMILEQRGKLDINEKIKKYLPDSPAAWDEVTVRHLLTHTSGIPSYTGFADYGRLMRQQTTPEALVARFRDRPLEFAPGEKFAYSNSGYALLGLLIDKVSGRPYASFVKEAIFDPVGMKNSGYDSPGPILKQRAAGYTGSGPLAMNAPFLDMSVPYSAGALYSTVDDLFLWDQALLTEKLLPSSAREAMFTPFKDDYGYGWTIKNTLGGRRTISHAGGINGFTTFIMRFPDDKVCTVVLSNAAQTPVALIARDLAAIALGEPYAVPGQEAKASASASVSAPVVAPGKTLEKLWGEGSFTEGGALARDGAILFSDIGNRIMRFDPATKQVTVFREPSGRANGLIFDPAGRLVAAEGANSGGGRRVSVTEADGTVRTLADRYEGKRFNSPNDVAVDGKGRVYVSDPRYVGGDARELDFEGVFRIDPNGQVARLTTTAAKPNGLVVSPDGKTLYVSDNGPARRVLLALDLDDQGEVSHPRVLHDFGDGRGIDGMTVTTDGRVVATAGTGEKGGVYVFTPSGERAGFIPVPEPPTNCEFGGPGGTTLYITAGKSLYRIETNLTGFRVWPKR